MPSTLHQADCLDWLAKQPDASIEALVTDPPYGLHEYSTAAQSKLRSGNRGGIWRIPPTLNGSIRAPLPRFTVITPSELQELHTFFGRLTNDQDQRRTVCAFVIGRSSFVKTIAILNHFSTKIVCSVDKYDMRALIWSGASQRGL